MLVEVRVATNCSTASVEKFGKGLKFRVKAKPVGGKANEEVIQLAANYFRVPLQVVKVVRGTTSNKKILEIAI